MIWNPFRAKAGPRLDEDRVWRTSSARLAGIYREATQADAVLVVAHFRATLEALRGLFLAQGQRCREYTDRLGAAALARPGGMSSSAGVPLVLAEALPAGPAGSPGDAPLLVLAAEHHFIAAKDDRIVAFCKALPMPSVLRFHEALDAPLLHIFMGDDMQRMLDEVGVPATESLEHAMVTRAIRNAQVKLAPVLTGDRSADSAQAWAQINLPQP